MNKFSDWKGGISGFDYDDSNFEKSLFCSYARLDAGHWAAVSSPSTAVGTTCGLPSVPCWSSMSAHICWSEYHSSVLIRSVAYLSSAIWRKTLLSELGNIQQTSSICKRLSLN